MGNQMRRIVWLVTVVVLSACARSAAPDTLPTIRLVSWTARTSVWQPVRLRVENVGPAGRFRAIAYNFGYLSGPASIKPDVETKVICRLGERKIAAHAMVDVQIDGCRLRSFDFLMIESQKPGHFGLFWSETACYDPTQNSRCGYNSSSRRHWNDAR